MIEQHRQSIRALQQTINGKPMVYVDWAATSQMPDCVIHSVCEAMMLRGNVRRGVHNLGAHRADLLEQARSRIARFIGATPSGLVLTTGTTDGLNRLVQSIGETLSPADVVLLSAVEHHAHLLPWQRMAQRYGFGIEIVPTNAHGRIDLAILTRLISQHNVKVLGFPMVSNVLGSVQPIREIMDAVRSKGIRVVVDAAQAVAHMPIDVAELGVDALVFGGHKIYGPTGTGVLWIREDWLSDLSPAVVGGGSTQSASYTDFEVAKGVYGFEPGTPNVSGFIGLARAIMWMEEIGWKEVLRQEKLLCDCLRGELSQIPEIRLLNPQPDIPLFTFEVDGLHAHDLGTLLDQEGIIVRTGHHCTQPFHDVLGIDSSTRISLSFLNTQEECAYVIQTLQRILGEFI